MSLQKTRNKISFLETIWSFGGHFDPLIKLKKVPRGSKCPVPVELAWKELFLSMPFTVLYYIYICPIV